MFCFRSLKNSGAFQGKTTGPQCLSAVMDSYDWSHSLTSDVYCLLPSRIDLMLHAHTEPMKTGGRNSRVSHEGVFFHNRSQYREKGTLQCTEKHIKRSSDALPRKHYSLL